MKVSFATNAAICTLQERWTSFFWSLLGLLREATYIRKVLYLRSKATAANSIFPTSLICLMVKRAFSIV